MWSNGRNKNFKCSFSWSYIIFLFFLVFLKEKNAISFLVMFKFNTNFLVFNSNKTWKFDGDSKSDFFYLKWLSEQQKFVIMIRCKINLDIIWYSVIFAATQMIWSDHPISWTWFYECCYSCFVYNLYHIVMGLMK